MPLPALAIPIISAIAGGVAGAGANKLFSGGAGGDGFQQRSILDRRQKPLYEQLIKSGMGPGAGGAFGQAADYYRNNLSDNPADMQAYAAPELRRFNEEIIPGISEQFAGMGAGGLSSSGFRNAAVNAGTDLSERLGAIRAKLRENSAIGLTNIGQSGLGNFTANTSQQQAPGFLESAGKGIGQGIIGLTSDYLKNKFANPETTPTPTASPNIPKQSFNLPNFSYKGSTSPYGSAFSGFNPNLNR